MSDTTRYTSPEQLAYADLLDLGMKIGFVALLVSFALYLSGIVPPHIPVEDLPKYWTMPVGEYLKAADVHTGWSWVHLVGKGDFLNFVGIAFLSAVTIGCYLKLLPMLLRSGDRVYASLAALEVVVLVLAASGILAAGH